LANKKIIAGKVKIAERIVKELRIQLGHDLRAVGLTGSIARGTAQKYSDIDHLIILKQPHPELPLYRIIEDTYCSLLYETRQSLNAQLTTPHHELPEILGGLTKILPLYDPDKIFKKIEAKAQSIPKELFHRCAELALIHSYEDFCRVKNACIIGDEIVLKDNIHAITHSIANTVAALNQRYFVSDREIFKAHKSFKKLPKEYVRIQQLRYGSLNGEKLFRTLLSFYIDVINFAAKEGIKFPVPEAALKML
jgi:predicted nucleotidyltransferase